MQAAWRLFDLIQPLVSTRISVASIERYYARHGMEASFPKRFLRPLLPRDAIIIDAGAHVGKDTMEWAQRYPAGQVYAFEPHPGLYKELVSRTNGYWNIITENLGLFDVEGTLSFHVSSGTSDGASSLLSPKEILNFHPGNCFDETIEVRCVRLDDYLRASSGLTCCGSICRGSSFMC